MAEGENRDAGHRRLSNGAVEGFFDIPKHALPREPYPLPWDPTVMRHPFLFRDEGAWRHFEAEVQRAYGVERPSLRAWFAYWWRRLFGRPAVATDPPGVSRQDAPRVCGDVRVQSAYDIHVQPPASDDRRAGTQAEVDESFARTRPAGPPNHAIREGRCPRRP